MLLVVDIFSFSCQFFCVVFTIYVNRWGCNCQYMNERCSPPYKYILVALSIWMFVDETEIFNFLLNLVLQCMCIYRFLFNFFFFDKFLILLLLFVWTLFPLIIFARRSDQKNLTRPHSPPLISAHLIRVCQQANNDLCIRNDFTKLKNYTSWINAAQKTILKNEQFFITCFCFSCKTKDKELMSHKINPQATPSSFFLLKFWIYTRSHK